MLCLLLFLFLLLLLWILARKADNPEDIDVLCSVAKAVANAMGILGEVYTPMRGSDWYSASGTFAEW